ncbi:hypothetical protein K474DRAFT_1591777 [Panus rudis PR-1116 ss-1]|nr:hypothetical protein K474DRAFT_1591777 [Panus rudis PR-1116 ss-1]
MDTHASSSRSPTLNPPSSPELRRRHSERTRSGAVEEVIPEAEPIQLSTSTASEHRRRPRQPRRPQTADTAETARRSSSSFFPGVPLPLTSSPTSEDGTRSSLTLSSSTDATVRPRAQTNPPFLQRLSINLFGSPSAPASNPQIYPNISQEQLVESPSGSLPASTRPSLSRPSVEIPVPRHEEESPEIYLHRLLEAVSKAEVATVLASSPDAFHARALRAYIDQFDFSNDALDVALRKLLMDVGLPRETQQIDRVIEAFAARYLQCNTNLFISDDHPYILAFSLIMLHTDAFNKSNKRKMTKADYVKNTRLPGVAPEVLDCFYDNIVFAPFIFIEDPLDVNGQRGLLPEGTANRRLSTLHASSPGGATGSGSTILGKSNRIDPYYLITRNLLDDLRVNVHAYVPPTSPFHYKGTVGHWDEDELLRAFATANVVEINPGGYYPAPWFSLGVGGGPGPVSIGGVLPSAFPMAPESFALKVTKVGMLMRKDDMLEGGKKPMNRKWREWSVLLTGSQLLLCRDPSWANMIQAKVEVSNGDVSLPHGAIPKPDELISVKDSIAVFDKSYTKYPNVLRLVMSDGRQVLFQAPSEREMNEWIARINYASAFKSAGVRMRSLGMSGKDIELTGKAAAASHLRDIQIRERRTSNSRVRHWENRSPVGGEGGRTSMLASTDPHPRRNGSIDSDAGSSPLESSTRLFKATFDQVKEDLAAGRWPLPDENSLRSFRPRAYSLESTLSALPSNGNVNERGDQRASSRSRIIRSKISELDSKLSIARGQLETDMRFVRNIAVLTPFQRATRERLQAAVQTVSKRIMQVRLDIEKLLCHRDVLSRDLLAEERDWQRTKRIALNAAAASLQRQQIQPPRMTLSVYLDDAEQSLQSLTAPADLPPRPSSSTSDSFHSAAEFGSRSSLEDRASSSSSIHANGQAVKSSPTPQHHETLHSLRVQERSGHTPQHTDKTAETAVAEDISHGHEKFVTAQEIPEEQAEEWNKTRAAKRVSLVRLPSDLRMSALFGKQGQGGRRSVSEEDVSSGVNADSALRRRSTYSPTNGTYARTNSTVATVAMLDL